MSSETNTQEPSETILKSVCRSCHGGCGALLHVKDGQLTKVEGDPDSPLNKGRLCPIGGSTMDLVYHPDRLKYPMRRKGERGSGQWERISWDEALDEIATKLQDIKDEYGAESIVMGTGTGRHQIRWVSRFGHALGTPNWCEPGFAQCFHPRINASLLTFGDFPVCDFTGDTPAKLIMYWGHNPVNSGPDGETRFNARDSLASKPKVIVIDPRETYLAKKADIWLQLRPGTDDALALAMLHVMIEEKTYDQEFVEKWTHGFDALAERVKQYSPEWAEEITWVSADKIREAARLFATIKPSLMEWGVAIEQTPNCIQTVRAISLIPAITGNIDTPGAWIFGMGGIGRFPSLIENLSKEANAKRLGGVDRFKLLCGEGADLPAAHIPSVLEAMREGTPYPVKAFMVFGNNTLTTYGNTTQVYESLKKLDFMVCADLFMTPTAELADIVLPAASWPELNQIVGLPTRAANVILAQQKSVQIGECKSDEEMFVELARRMNLDCCTEPVEDVLDEQLQAGIGMSFKELSEIGFYKVPFKYHKFEENGFKTPTGKIELFSTRFEEMGYDPLPYYEEPPESPISTPDVAKDFPLVLTSGGRIPFFFNSEHRQLKKLRKAHPEPIAEIHPDTAQKYGIENGDWMWIASPRGKMRQKAKLWKGIDPRVIHVEHGWWFPEKPAPEYGVFESNANLLTSNLPPYDPQMGTYQLRGLLCKVEKTTEP